MLTDFGLPFSHVVLSADSKGYNRGIINLAPESLDFGTIVVGVVPTGTSDTEKVTAINGGKSNLTVTTRMAFAATGGGAFRLITNLNLKDVPGREVLPIFVVFQPPIPGTFDDTLLIQSNDSAFPMIRVPLHGRAMPETGTLDLSPTSLDFGKVMLGHSDTLDLTAKNPGVSMLTVAATMPTEYSGDPISLLINHHMVIVHRDESLTIPVAFKPTTLGFFYDTVLLETNDTLRAAVKVPVRGEGVPAAGVEIPIEGKFSVYPVIANREVTIHLPVAEDAAISIVDFLG